MPLKFAPAFALHSMVQGMRRIGGNQDMTYRQALFQAVREVAAPAIKSRFETSGEGRWPALSRITVDRKGHPFILIESNKLSRAASAMARWKIKNDQAQFSIGGSPAPYGVWHERGTKRMPQRNYAYLNAEDAQRIQEIFGKYATIEFERL